MNNVTQFMRKHVLAILVVAVALAVPFGVASAKYTTTKAVATDIEVTVEKGYYLDKSKMWTVLKALSSDDYGATSLSFVHGNEIPSTAALQTTRVQVDDTEELGCYWDATNKAIYIAPTDSSDSGGVIYAPADCSDMFSGYGDSSGKITKSLKSINFGNFNTSKTTSMNRMFYACSGPETLDLSGFNTSKVTGMEMMFTQCSSLKSLNVSNFDTSKVPSFSQMFYGCYALQALDLSSFETGNVTTMHQMFLNNYALTSLDLSSFDTGKVTDMQEMFYECSALTTVDISSWTTDSLTSDYVTDMFCLCGALKTIYASTAFDNTNIMSGNMFLECSSLEGGKGTTYDDYNTDTADFARIDGGEDSPGYFTDIADKPTS